MKATTSLPIAIIGAGPVGLAAAARVVSRRMTPLVFERGPEVGSALRAWGHVRVFSPWQYNIDGAARELLAAAGWDEPEPTELPTGNELVDRYLQPLAALPGIAQHLHLSATVTAITRLGLDKLSDAGRAEAPFVIRWRDGDGGEHMTLAAAVIDASGTWHKPSPMGVDGLAVPGEAAASSLIAYGIPDVAGAERATYSDKTVLVVGSGHSAVNVALALMALQDEAPATRIIWAIRRKNLDRLFGGGLNDQLPERGALGIAAKKAIEAGRLQLLTAFAAQAIQQTPEGLLVEGTLDRLPVSLRVDRAVVATGFRPDTAMLRELRISLEPSVEAPPALAPLVDPNLHSCGTVPPHGVDELAHPEPGFFIVGSKSYGRAPTFLMATGYEQARSVVAELAGDHVAAREVHLVLPETGVCSTAPITGAASSAGCCGGPAASADACCVADEVAKSAGRSGCGCGEATAIASNELQLS